MTTNIGRPVPRVDGRQKVTGAARYTAETVLPGLLHATIVGATIAHGRVVAVDTSAARTADGVVAVYTHENLPKIPGQPHLIPSLFGFPAPGQSHFPLQDDRIHFAGQPVAVVVAEEHEQAQYAARLVRVEYAPEPSITTVEQGREQAYEPERIFGGFVPARTERGDVAAGLAEADVRVDATYRLAANHHHPIEPSATVAVWDGDQVTVHDTTMGIKATQLTVSALLGLHPTQVRVLTRFVGGSFGAKAMVWPHVALTAHVARQVGRPVKLVLTRPQMSAAHGHREAQEHRVAVGVRRDGTLTAIQHQKISVTSPFDDWAEPVVGVSSSIYRCANFSGVHRLVRGNTMTPTFTRGPGEAAGMFALESTLDEVAERLGIDPVELRLRNLSETDQNTGKPWSSSGVAECFARGAARFGWDPDRTPRRRRDGHWLIGTGVATSAYPVVYSAQVQRARARLYSDGTAVVETGTQEFGTGVSTVMGQVAADALGLALDRVRFEFGDTNMPNSSATVGSAGAGSISAAVHRAGTALRDQLVGRAVADPGSPLHGAAPESVVVTDGRMALRDDPEVGETYGELMHRGLQGEVEAIGEWRPTGFDAPFGMMTFGAQFAEVAVDEDLGLVRVRRLVGAFAPGRVLNRSTARSQLMGGMIWGMGQALLEGNEFDPRSGRWANNGLGEYLVAVNADVPEVEIELVEVEDRLVNPLGVKGVGEIGLVGTAAAIANAVHHATGQRVRDLPITVEQLLPAVPFGGS
ncbi:xanthine dehydrogenase family protein molybdopterin-binding subunit [Micromonospora sp. NPDC049559]|uniref:xanthine dehydrogenase family protein molybdopterin-binding subunit n=1 Tax=Micromonospora sp. NPDC049559 TaxID=3155923 RepID=UPI00341BED69